MSTAATSAEDGYKSASFVFDSYAYVRRLRDAGMDEQQAAIQAETFMALAEDRLATKQDIAELKRDIETTKAELKRDIETTKAELKRDIETTKAELKRDIAVIEAQVEATKAQVEATRAELKRDIAVIEAQVEATKAELKRDIATLDGKVETAKAELRREIETTKAELKRDIETTKAELQAALQKDIALARVTTIQWTAGMFVAQTALILGALFAVMRMNQPPVYQPPVQEMRQSAPATTFPVPPAASVPAQPAR